MSSAQWEPYESGKGSDHEAAADPHPLSTRPEAGDQAHPDRVEQELQQPVQEPTMPAETKPSRLARPLPFEAWFRQLEKFVADNGFRLGRWVFRLREEERRARLAPEERAALESQPGWSWERKKKTPPSEGQTSEES
jgi:hypothetical protein